MMSIALLFLHSYYYCYQAFVIWGWRSGISDQLLVNISKTGLFNHFQNAKLIAIALLMISLIGSKGRKKENVKVKTSVNLYGDWASTYFS